MKNNKIYDFGGFRLDMEQESLWREDELVSLTPKAYETLLVLVKNHGRVTTKNTLLDEVWANTFVEEATLAQNISTLRKTFAKYDSETEFIATVPRRGYRFVEDVAEISMEDEEVVLEKHTVTTIVAEQRQIHDSDESNEADIQTRKDAVAPTGGLSSNKRTLVLFALLGVGALAIGYFAMSYFSKAKTLYSSKFRNFQIATLFSGPNLQSAIVSPDGKYLAVVNRNAGGDKILLKQIEEGNMIEVLPKSNLFVKGITFSQTGEQLFYSAYQRSNNLSVNIGKLYRIPILAALRKKF